MASSLLIYTLPWPHTTVSRLDLGLECHALRLCLMYVAWISHEAPK